MDWSAPARRAAPIRSTASPKRPGATGSRRDFAAELEAKPSYAMFQDHRRRRRGPRAGPRRPQWTERHGSDRPGRGPAEARRSRLLPGNDPARSQTNLRLAARSRPLQRTDRGGAPADGPRRDADLRKRRKAVRHFHGQCRHAARVRPRPVIGVAGRDDLCRQPVRRLSHSSGSFARIRRAARQAQRLESRLPASGGAGWGNARQRRHRSGPGRPARRDSFRPCPSGRGRMGRRHRNNPVRRDHGAGCEHQEHLASGRSDRGVVSGRAGALDRAVADPADRPADRSRSGGGRERARPPFRSMRAARPACSRARLRRRSGR